MYQLKITARAKKELKAISRIYQKQSVYNALEEIRDDPFSGKPLIRELTGRYRYKVGVYRIIYKIDKPNRKVYIITVGYRSRVYS